MVGAEAAAGERHRGRSGLLERAPDHLFHDQALEGHVVAHSFARRHLAVVPVLGVEAVGAVDLDLAGLDARRRGLDQPPLAPLIAAAERDREEDDGLLQEVLTFIQEVDEVSISLLQRKFRIGYNRSARIIDSLEAKGLILPSEGGKTRKVIRH